MIGETCPSFSSNRISASLRGRPSAPTTLPSTEDICAETVAVKTNELTRTRLAMTACLAINQTLRQSCRRANPTLHTHRHTGRALEFAPTDPRPFDGAQDCFP